MLFTLGPGCGVVRALFVSHENCQTRFTSNKRRETLSADFTEFKFNYFFATHPMYPPDREQKQFNPIFEINVFLFNALLILFTKLPFLFCFLAFMVLCRVQLLQN